MTFLVKIFNTWRCEHRRSRRSRAVHSPAKSVPVYPNREAFNHCQPLASKMPYTFRAGDLPKLDFDIDRGSDFLAWEKQWNSYMTLSGLADSDAAIQVHALQFCMSRETLTIMENLGLTDAQKADQAQIIAGEHSYSGNSPLKFLTKKQQAV